VRRLGAALGIGAACVWIAGCVHTTAGTAKPADTGGVTATLSPTADLNKALLSAGEIGSIMGVSDIAVVNSAQDLQANSETVSDPNCLGALYSAEESVYQGSGWTDVRDEVLQEPVDNSAHWVEQTAVKFPGSQLAQVFLATSLSRWSTCSGKHVTFTGPTDEHGWQIGDLNLNYGMLVQTSMQQTPDGWGCQHAMGAVSDVVIEVSACNRNIGNQAFDIAEKIAAKIP
jgi:hypothetical protein